MFILNRLYKIYIFFFPILLLFNSACAIDSEDYYEKKRKKMVQNQIVIRGIQDSCVISAMKTVKRHLFVPLNYRRQSYEDHPLPIGYGQTISQPYIVALMTELLKLNKNVSVLEIGTGSGYQAAILASIVEKVYTVEIVEPLHIRSSEVLKKEGYYNVHTKSGDGYFGWKEYAPYDAIIVTCAAEFIPPPLIKQMKIGGIMCIPVGPPFSVQKLLVIEKKNNEEIETRVITYVSFVPLVRK